MGRMGPMFGLVSQEWTDMNTAPRFVLFTKPTLRFAMVILQTELRVIFVTFPRFLLSVCLFSVSYIKQVCYTHAFLQLKTQFSETKRKIPYALAKQSRVVNPAWM